MLTKQVRGILANLVRGKILFDEPMKNHTSLRIGGPAEAMIIPKDAYDLKNLLSFAEKNRIHLTIIGNGTKLLVSDDGIDGITVKISGCLDNVTVFGTEVKAGAGHPLAHLSRLVADYDLSGLEFAVGIPGTVGGGVVMNAGAHGFAISNVVTNVIVLSFEGKTKKYSKNELRFGYRRSRFQNNHCIVLSVEMELAKDNVEKIRKRMDRYILWRKINQPLDLPNAGSVFKNPNGLVAGKLIDNAGLKAFTVGDATISEKRANFIVNLGKATALDVQKLMQIVQKKIFKKYHIKLEPEIRIIGAHTGIEDKTVLE